MCISILRLRIQGRRDGCGKPCQAMYITTITAFVQRQLFIVQSIAYPEWSQSSSASSSLSSEQLGHPTTVWNYFSRAGTHVATTVITAYPHSPSSSTTSLPPTDGTASWSTSRTLS